MKTKSPLMQQYDAIKNKYPDAILLFQVNQFYEAFGIDAELTAQITGTVLTKNKEGLSLTGFESTKIDKYLPMLVRAGHRVALCDPS